MEKDTFYLVTNGNALFIINKFNIMDDFFYYWNLMNLNWEDNLQIPWLEAQIKTKRLVWHIYHHFSWKFMGRWRTKTSSAWTRGPIIPIIPIPSPMMDGFMNWTKNPLED